MDQDDEENIDEYADELFEKEMMKNQREDFDFMGVGEDEKIEEFSDEDYEDEEEEDEGEEKTSFKKAKVN